MEKSGWYSRGYLPHFDVPGLVQSITIRLFDSLPRAVVHSVLSEIKHLPEDCQDLERRKRFESYLDRGYGACWLSKPEIASCVEERLLAGDADTYMLLAWTIMPNHVHAIIELADETTLSEMLGGWKGATSRSANIMLGRSGPFWYREYHDRYIRDDAHLRNAVRYVHDNPVKARLCARAADWPFGSARLGP